MNNVLYGVLDDTKQQLNLTAVVLTNTVVGHVVDAEGTTYEGNAVTLITDRDFLYVPDLDQSLTVGDEIYLDNQTIQRWRVCKGWYSVDDNPPINGWYLESIPAGKIRSLFLKDFNSLTFVTPKTEFTLPTVLPDNPAEG